MNPFKDIIIKQGKECRLFLLHWKNRHDPVTMMVIGGTVMSAYGQYQQGQAAAEQGKMEQEIMNQNAALKEREAAAARARAYEEARQFQREGEFLQGEQQVKLAKGGVLTSTGTPASLMEETANALKEDKMAILKEGFLNESFMKSEAENLRYQGRAAKVRGQNARTGATYGALGSILTGVGSVYTPRYMDNYLSRKHGIA